jgi:chloramphenicol-sensitive protein RarD
MRKIAHVAPMPGLAIETALLLPVALIYLATRGAMAVTFDSATWGLILLSGLMTVTPLLAFTAAMRRLQLSTMGFLQYVGPTCQFCCGVFLYGEHIRPMIPGFLCIWIALIIYSIDSLRGYRSALNLAVAEI